MSKKNDKISMPQTPPDLETYFDQENIHHKLTHKHVIVITVILAIFCFVLRFSG